MLCFFFFQAEDGIRDAQESRGLGDVYKRQGLYHREAAACMKVSRQTFGRIVISARRKIADALINGKALRIEEEIKTTAFSSLDKNRKTNEDTVPSDK